MADKDLSIKITAEATTAYQALDKLSGRFNTLSSSLSNISKLNTSAFQKIGSGIQMLANGMQSFKGIGEKKFDSVAKGISKLNSVDAQQLTTLANALNPLSSSLQTLSGTQFNNKGITNLINALTRLSNSNIGSISNMSFDTLGNSIVSLSNKLASAKTVSSNTIQLTNAIANLGATGSTIGLVASELTPLGAAIVQLTGNLANAPVVSSEIIELTNALGLLASAGARTATTAANLGTLGTELYSLMATMSKAPTVSNNTIQMTQALAQLAAAGKNVNSSFNSASSGLNRYSGSVTKAHKVSKSFAQVIGKVYANFWLLFRLFSKIGDTIDYSSQLTEVQNVVDTTFGDMNYKVDEFAENSIKQFGMSELSVKQYASRFQAMGQAMGISASKIASANEFLNSATSKTNADGVTESYVGLSDSMSDVSLNLTKLTADLASFYDMEQSDVAEDLESIFTGSTRPLRTYGLDLTEATLKEWALKNGLDADISSMSQAEKTMLRYQYVLANTTAAQNDFSKTADTWANQIRILKQQLQQLGGTVGTAFINMLKPLVKSLNTALGYVQEFVEKVVNALGVIFGWKIEIQNVGISQAADDAESLADGTGTAADNAKKLKQQLQGFHELNVLTSNDSSSGSGSGSSGTSASGGATNKGYTIKETEGLFDSDINNLYQLGSYISESLKKSMDKIDWDYVYSSAKNFGTGLADFLNGLIQPSTFYSIGNTIGGYLNATLYSINSFAATFKWDNLGQSIADVINGFFTTTDFKLAADTFNRMANGIVDSLREAVADVEWDTVGDKIGDLLSGLNIVGLAGKLLDLAGRIIVGLGEALLNVADDSPLTAAIIGVVGSLKLYNAAKEWVTNIGPRIANWLGVTLSSQTVTANPTVNVSGAGVTGAGTVSQSIGGKILSGLQTWLKQPTATAGLASIGGAIVLGLGLGSAISKSLNNAIAGILESSGDYDTASYYREYSGIGAVIALIDETLGYWYRDWKERNVTTTGTELNEDWKGVFSGGALALTKKNYNTMDTDEWVESLPAVQELKESGLGKTTTTTGTSSNPFLLNAPTKFDLVGRLSVDEIDDKTTKKDKTLKNGSVNVTKTNDKISASTKKKGISGIFATLSSFTDKVGTSQKKSGISGIYATLSNFTDKVETSKKKSGLSGFFANLQNVTDNLTASQKTLATTSNYTKTKDSLTALQKTFDSTGKFTQRTTGGGWSTLFDAIGKFTSRQTGGSWSTTFDSKGNFTSRSISGGFSTIFDSISNFTSRTTGGNWSNLFDTIGRFTSRTTGGNWSNLFDTIGRFTSRTTGGNWSNLFDTIGRFTSRTTGGNWSNLFDTIGRFTSRTTGGNWSTIFNTTGNFTNTTDNVPTSKRTLWITGKITDLVSGLGNLVVKLGKKADGGIYVGGQWKNVAAYASGGYPSSAQLFMARESGPELVGTIGTHTAVVNNDQIVASVASGVASAVGSVMSSVMSRMNTNGSSSQPLVVYLDGKEVFNSTRQYANDYYRMTGTSAFPT